MSLAFVCINKYKLYVVLDFIDSAGQLVVKYKYTAYGKVTVTKDTDGLADVNPFKYKGYYFDLESGMYYCHTRYYVPEWGRWLCQDSIQFIEHYQIDKLNLHSYCGNNPISRFDLTGSSWSSFWKNVGNWFKKTFSGFVDLSYKIVDNVYENVFGGYEDGVIVGDIVGDDSKPISFFAKNASAPWKINEYQIGFKINIGKFHLTFSSGLGEAQISAGYKNTSFDFQTGINKIGIGISQTVETSTYYSQAYIRTIPTLLLAAILIFAPQYIPCALGAAATMA